MDWTPGSRPADPTRRGTLGLLRLVVVGLVLALSVPVTPLEASPRVIWSIVLASVTAVTIALWRPVWGAVLLAAAMAATATVDVFGYELGALAVVSALVTVVEPWRRAALALGLLTTAVVLPWLIGRPAAGMSWSLAAVLVGIVVGLVTRPFAVQMRAAARRIAALGREQARVRAEERTLLADELSRLLNHELREAAHALAGTSADGEPAALRAALRRAATTASDSLMRLRCLVMILRGEVASGESGPVDPLTMLELLEEVLVGHGVQVTTEGTPPAAGSPAGSALLNDVLREATVTLPAHAVPGSTVAVRLTSDDELALVIVASAVSEMPATCPGALASRVHAAGGRLEWFRGDGTFRLGLTLPWVRAEQSDSAPVASRPIDVRRIGRLASIPLAAVALALAVVGVLHHGAGIWWGLSLAVLALALLPRAPWLGLAVASATFAVYGLADRPSDAGLVAAVVVTSLIAATRGFPSAAGALVASVVFLAARPLTTAGPQNLTLAILLSLAGLSIGLLGSYLLALRDAQRRQLARLAEELSGVRDRERRLLAGELHDVVAHQLSLIALMVSVHADGDDRTDLLRTREATVAALGSAQADLSTLLHVLRRTPDQQTVALLQPSALSEGLRATVEKTGRRLVVEVDPTVDAADASTVSTLNRILREAVTNLMRYAAGGSTARLSVRVVGDDVNVVVSSPLAERTPSDALSTGTGLLGLRERVLLTGGTFSAGREGGEWVVRARLRRSGVEVPSYVPAPTTSPWPALLRGILGVRDGLHQASSASSLG